MHKHNIKSLHQKLTEGGNISSDNNFFDLTNGFYSGFYYVPITKWHQLQFLLRLYLNFW